MAIQAQINTDNIVIGILDTTEPLTGENYIPVDSFDTSLVGKIWNGKSFEENPNKPKITTISQLDFWKRFTTEERIATKSSTDPIVKDFVDMVSLSQAVSLTDPDVINGVTQLELLEILSDGRADEILLIQDVAP